MYKLNEQQQHELLELLCALIRHKSENPPGKNNKLLNLYIIILNKKILMLKCKR